VREDFGSECGEGFGSGGDEDVGVEGEFFVEGGVGYEYDFGFGNLGPR
jgi:hypothetical protein